MGRGWLRLVLAAGLLAPVACADDASVRLESPGNRTAVVGETLELILLGRSEDDAPITYDFRALGMPMLSETATISNAPGGFGLFTLSPTAPQVGSWYFDFIASDGEHEAIASVTIDVLASSGLGERPRFREPSGSGLTLDIEEDPCMTFDILVDDPDSTSLALTVEPELFGAEFLVGDGGFQGRWSWCPPDGAEAAAPPKLLLSADDGEGPPSVKPYQIVVRRGDGEECDGDAPTIEHTADDASADGEVRIAADVDDDLGVFTAPAVAWSLTKPDIPVDFTQLTLATMTLESGDETSGRWVASFPAPAAEGTLYYAITATDDDDPFGPCDHTSDSPSSGGVHELFLGAVPGDVPPPDPPADDPDAGDPCEDDPMAPGCPDAEPPPPPEPECPWMNDGVCDAPLLCPEGTDTADCS